MKKQMLLFLAAASVATIQAGAGDLELAVRGTPAAYTIVVPEKASPSQRYAAEELRDFTEKTTGVKLPIATDAAPLPAKAILLGETKYTDVKANVGTDGFRLVEEHSFNEEMKKYSIRGKLFALLLPKMNDRWATFKW